MSPRIGVVLFAFAGILLMYVLVGEYSTATCMIGAFLLGLACEVKEPNRADRGDRE